MNADRVFNVFCLYGNIERVSYRVQEYFSTSCAILLFRTIANFSVLVRFIYLFLLNVSYFYCYSVQLIHFTVII